MLNEVFDVVRVNEPLHGGLLTSMRYTVKSASPSNFISVFQNRAK